MNIPLVILFLSIGFAGGWTTGWLVFSGYRVPRATVVGTQYHAIYVSDPCAIIPDSGFPFEITIHMVAGIPLTRTVVGIDGCKLIVKSPEA